MKRKIYFKGKKGNLNQDSSASNTNILHHGQILVGPNKGGEEDTLDKLEKIMLTKSKGWYRL